MSSEGYGDEGGAVRPFDCGQCELLYSFVDVIDLEGCGRWCPQYRKIVVDRQVAGDRDPLRFLMTSIYCFTERS